MDEVSRMATDLVAGALMFVVAKLPIGKRWSWGLLASIAAGWFALQFKPFAVPVDETTAERLAELGRSGSLVAAIVGLSLMSSRMWETEPSEPEPPPPDRTAGLSPRREGWRPRWSDWKMILIRYIPAEVMIFYGGLISLFAMLEPDEDLTTGLTGLAVAAVGGVFTYIRLQNV